MNHKTGGGGIPSRSMVLVALSNDILVVEQYLLVQSTTCKYYTV